MKMILCATIVLLSQLAMAASPEALKAVLDNSEVQALSDITSISETVRYKCPNCYDIKVVGTQEVVSGFPAQEKSMIIRTEGSVFSADITTTVIESTK